MNKAIEQMLEKYTITSTVSYEHALKEIIQEIVLLGLWRAKFFEHAAFYGGTALRIFYGLDRFSEDLDFSLIKKNQAFDLTHYHKAVADELTAFGFTVHITQKDKTNVTAIQSAFIKADTLQYDIGVDINHDKRLKVKFEVDTNPPYTFNDEVKLLLNPTEFYVRLVSTEDLLAGKLHAVLCRKWKNRIKGRDWYDLIWFIKQDIAVNVNHLKARMVQSGHLEQNANFTEKELYNLLNEAIEKLDIELAKKDILPFILEPSRLDIWSYDFFKQLIDKLNYA